MGGGGVHSFVTLSQRVAGGGGGGSFFRYACLGGWGGGVDSFVTPVSQEAPAGTDIPGDGWRRN